MHAHDRTLIARLGFGDPDKGDRRHDLACQYLVTPEVVRKLIGALLAPSWDVHLDPIRDEDFAGTQERVGVQFAPGILEFPLTKGEGQYKTTLGFLDVVIPYSYSVRRVGEFNVAVDGSSWRREWRFGESTLTFTGLLVIEAKILPVGLGDVLRQVNFYREFPPQLRSADLLPGLNRGYQPDSPRLRWALATAYPVPADEVTALRAAAIHHVRLGDAFAAWCREREEAAARPDAGCESITV